MRVKNIFHLKHGINSFIVCLFAFFYSQAFQLIFYSVFFFVVMLNYCFRKCRKFGTIKTFDPAANVCTCPKSGI